MLRRSCQYEGDVHRYKLRGADAPRRALHTDTVGARRGAEPLDLSSFREESPDRLIEGHGEIRAGDDRIDWGRLSDQESLRFLSSSGTQVARRCSSSVRAFSQSSASCTWP